MFSDKLRVPLPYLVGGAYEERTITAYNYLA